MTSRKQFLIASAAVAAALPAAADAASPSPAPAPSEKPWPPFVFDTAAFDRALNGPQTHKHLFSTVEIKNGIIFDMVGNTLLGYKEIGVPLIDVLPAVVMYHGVSIAMGFDDRAWDTYVIPGVAKMKSSSGPHAEAAVKQFEGVIKPGVKGNPFLHSHGGEDDNSIEALERQTGMRLFMCNLATRGFSEFLAKQLGMKAKDVYDDIAAHLVPNAMLTPSGVWAIHAVQQHDFTLLPVTVVG
jgi:hypothetical protein